MKLYLSHASSFDNQTELYDLLKKALAGDHDLYLPHDLENDGKNSKQIITSSDFVLAEVSYPSTGQGIELGWAEAAGVPIVCFYKEGMHPSNALQHLTSTIFPYTTPEELITKLAQYLS